jgi:hypothetical protein
VGDILSQRGGRGTGPWPRWLAVLAALVLVTILIVEHLPHHPPAKTEPRRAAVSVAPAPGPAARSQAAGSQAAGSQAAGSQAVGPEGVSGLAMPRDGSLRLPANGPRPAWLWPATGRTQPIGGLPRDGSGYQFIRVAGGWAIQASSAARLGCGSCAGSLLPVYFLADDARSATPVGTADAVAPSAAAGALWLTSYPPGADVSTAAGTAREVSVTGTPAGRDLKLPAGYVIYRGTDRGLLLAPAAPAATAPSATAAYRLWSPAAPRAVGRTFDGVLAASAHQIAWATRCDPVCRAEVVNLETGRQTVVSLPGASSAVNGAFSPDGKFLTLQVSFSNLGDDGALAMQLDVVSLASGNPSVVPALRVSSDALVGFGWPASGDDLVAELNFIAKVQLASWHPDARRLAVAVIRPGPESASLIVG